MAAGENGRTTGTMMHWDRWRNWSNDWSVLLEDVQGHVGKVCPKLLKKGIAFETHTHTLTHCTGSNLLKCKIMFALCPHTSRHPALVSPVHPQIQFHTRAILNHSSANFSHLFTPLFNICPHLPLFLSAARCGCTIMLPQQEKVTLSACCSVVMGTQGNAGTETAC